MTPLPPTDTKEKTMVKLTDQASIPQVIAEMTLEEKVSAISSPAPVRYIVERLGIPAYTRADGHNGINMMQIMGSLPPGAEDDEPAEENMVGGFALHALLGQDNLVQLLSGQGTPESLEKLPPEQQTAAKALARRIAAWLPEGGLPTCFPPGIVMGATWNPELVGECGRAVAKESLGFEVDILLGPNVNIHRDPLCGRVFESYSEDPYLTSQIVIDYIQGVQKEGVAANVKHFAANNQETMRMGIDEIISERALREIYYPAFKAAIQKGRSWTVMSAYNSINGVPCAHSHHLLTEVLRDEWGFDGFVLSDAGAVYDSVQALLAGNDMEMPPPQNPQAIVDAVKAGDLPESVLDERVANVLRILLKLPAFQGRRRDAIDREFSVRIARDIALEGAVLLKNENGALPLAEGGHLAVLGENAHDPITTGGGSAEILSPYRISLLEGLRDRFGENAVTFGQIADGSTAAIVAIGVHSGEGHDRKTLELPDQDVTLIAETAQACRAAGIPIIVVLNICGPIEMADWIDDVDAVLLIWLAGQELGHATAALLAGDENPSGKLPLTFPRVYRDTPTALNFPGELGEVRYGEGIFVGYRYYQAQHVTPQFPFGYGLSYTDFQIDNLRLSADVLDLKSGQAIVAAVDVTNTGDRPGKEVVQLYISDPKSTVQKPPQELKGFAKVAVAPGQTVTVEIPIHAESLQHYDSQLKQWCVEPGTFEVRAGASSSDISLRAAFEATGPNPYAYGPRTAIGKLAQDPRSREVLIRHLPHMASPAMLGVIEQFIYDIPMDKMFDNWISRLSHTEMEQIAALKARLYADLAAIQV
jgi:beta-glucosidase